MKYNPIGPFEIPINPRRRVEKSDLKAFWEDIEDSDEGLSSAVGCYVFGLKNKSYIPWYVGLAEKQTFSSECFSVHKLNIYNEAISLLKKRQTLFNITAEIFQHR